MRASPLFSLGVSLLVAAASLSILAPTVAAQTNVGVIDSNAFLSVLSFSVGTLLPPFAPNETSYTLLMPIGQGSTVIHTAMQDPDGGSHVFKQGYADGYWINDPAAQTIYMDVGVTPFRVTTYGKSAATKIDYLILIYRPATISSDNANLVGVTFSTGTVTPATFSSKILAYTVNLGSANPSYEDITVTAADSNAYLEVRVNNNNAQTFTSGVTKRFTWDPTITTIRINSIAQSARAVNVYTFTFVRNGALESGNGTGTDDSTPTEATGATGVPTDATGVPTDATGATGTPTLPTDGSTGASQPTQPTDTATTPEVPADASTGVVLGSNNGNSASALRPVGALLALLLASVAFLVAL